MINTNSTLYSRMFYLVPASPWPILSALSLFFMLFGLVQTLHGSGFGIYLSYLGLTLLLFTITHWWFILTLESTSKAFHTTYVQDGLKIAMLIFIISEIMFFFGFFWSFFQASLAPTFYIGGVWPPKYLVTLNPWTFPLLNTLILLSSGATVTWAHQSLIQHQISLVTLPDSTNLTLNSTELDLMVVDSTDHRVDIMLSLGLTLILASIFTLIQNYEYQITTFSIESIYGSVFFLLTGFHGFHVLCGTLFLLTFLLRFNSGQYTNLQSTSFIHFELAAWYWHFVDVVWIFLFIFVYWWGG